MAKYYFDCFDGQTFHTDAFGIDLDDADEAMDHGACLTVSLLGEMPISLGARSVSVIVRSSSGAPVYVAQCGFSGFKSSEESRS